MTRPFFERIATVAIEKKSPIVLALDPRPPGNQRLQNLQQDHLCSRAPHLRRQDEFPYHPTAVCVWNFEDKQAGPLFWATINSRHQAERHRNHQRCCRRSPNKDGLWCRHSKSLYWQRRTCFASKRHTRQMQASLRLYTWAIQRQRRALGSKYKGALYKMFFERATASGVDGIVVGATQDKILKEIAGRLPVYSPGVGAQGGDAEQTIRNGADYLIIGRSIVEAKQHQGRKRNPKQNLIDRQVSVAEDILLQLTTGSWRLDKSVAGKSSNFLHAKPMCSCERITLRVRVRARYNTTSFRTGFLPCLYLYSIFIRKPSKIQH